MQAFVNERTPVVSVRWSEWAAPAGLDEHRRWVSEHLAADPVPAAVNAYEELLAEAGSATIRHETLLTVTVHVDKVRRRRGRQQQLARGGGDVGDRDPPVRPTPRGCGFGGVGPAVADAVGLAPCGCAWTRRPAPCWMVGCAASATPAAARSPTPGRPRPAASGHGGSPTVPAHRAFVVSDWPRLDVHAGWLRDLMLWAGSVRSVTVVFEPIARSRSYRSVMRDAAKIESDANHRSEKGFRVGAQHRRAAQAVDEREEEARRRLRRVRLRRHRLCHRR